MELEYHKNYTCIIKVRPLYKGCKVMECVTVLNERHYIMKPLWLMDDEDPYPGEWAMSCEKYHEDSGRSWIASGDLRITNEVIGPVLGNTMVRYPWPFDYGVVEDKTLCKVWGITNKEKK